MRVLYPEPQDRAWGRTVPEVRRERTSGGKVLKRDEGAGKPRAGAIEEEAHAQRFGALDGNEAHLAAHVVEVVDHGELGFVPSGVALEAGDALFDGLAEAGADFESFVGESVGNHGWRPPWLWKWGGEIYFRSGLKFPSTEPIVAISPYRRQITDCPILIGTSVIECPETGQGRRNSDPEVLSGL